MGEESRSPEASNLASELDGALTTLETSLADASRSVAALRGTVAQVADLADMVRQIDAAMVRARENLSLPPTPQAPEHEADSHEPTTAAPANHTNGPGSICLRLDVRSRAGSLDLKAVDGSVNETPAVVDVALLDYDGRQAALKLWVAASANPDEVREALLLSLRRRLGDDGDAEVRGDSEEKASAA